MTLEFWERGIGTSTTVLFSVTAAAMVGFGVYAESAVSTASDATQKLYNHPFMVTNSLREINLNVVAIHRSMKDVALAADPVQIDAAVQDIDSREKIVLERLDVARGRYLGDVADIDALKAAVLEWRPVRQSAISKYRQGNVAEVTAAVQALDAQKVKNIEDKVKKITDFAMSKAESFK